jgi:hypothetical protein
MIPVPVRSQPASRAVFLAALLAATWIYDYIRRGDARTSILAAGLDIALLILLIIVCLFVFAQFVLPIKTLPDRLRVAGRLWLHAWGAHGPAVFVQNGREVERRGGAGRVGPGLIWVDTASAALTRTEAGLRRVLGPGIHFTERLERIERTFSLHIQSCSMGPSQDEQIFGRFSEDESAEERIRHEAMQVKRRGVSGLTRDGNEVVPEIRVIFKMDGTPAIAGQPGSRFGFSSEAVRRAAHGEGMTADPEAASRIQVAWNQLPGLIAVDLWREYLAKFTLEDLFAAQFDAVPEVLQPEEPAQRLQAEAETHGAPQGPAARLLWRLNNSLEGRLSRHGGRGANEVAGAPPSSSSAQNRQMLPGRAYTALQIIAHMVRARMAQAAVPILDECGRYGKGHFPSEEYKRLRERGIRILDVKLGGYRFAPAVEEQIVQHWRTTWLENAADERLQAEQLEVLATEAGRQQALLDHAKFLGRELRAESGTSVPALVKSLLLASHAEILTDERLHARGAQELEGLAALAKWVDSPNDG